MPKHNLFIHEAYHNVIFCNQRSTDTQEEPVYVRRLQVKFISWVFSNADGKHMLSYSVQHPLLIASGIRGLTLSPSELWPIPQGSVYRGMPK